MASIHREISIDAPPEHVWSAIRDIGALHTRLVPGFVTDTILEDGARVVTFGNGTVARELIVDVDEGARRIAWAAVGTRMTHHNASLQVFAENGGTRAVWIADLLPHDLAPAITAMIEQGLAVMRRAMEASVDRGAGPTAAAAG
jgi:carbon monoxide dehydrogenase subunit G